MKRTCLYAAVAALCAGGATTLPAFAQSFSETYFFGDSLTDSGAYRGNADAVSTGKFTTNPGAVWSERFATHFGGQALANNPNNPANTDAAGTNYAQGGAQVANLQGVGGSPSPQGALPVTTQVGNALSARGGADPNAMYVVWAGANDVFFQLERLLAGADPADVEAQIIAGATALTQQVGILRAAGARYVLVPNLPDIGDTPAVILMSVMAAGANNPNLANAMAAATIALAQPAADAAGQAAVEQAAIAAAAEQLGIPAAALTAVVAQGGAALTALSEGFNQAADALLPTAGANVIRLDIYGMFKEILADPATFGLLNVTGMACTSDSAMRCGPDQLLVPGADQGFMFADIVHPTSAGHALIADYAVSVVEAPALIANLAEMPLYTQRLHQRSLEGQMRAGRMSTPVGEWGLFAALEGGARDIEATRGSIAADGDAWGLLAGAGYRASDSLYGGLALGRSEADTDFAGGRGGFDMSAYYLSAFVDYRGESIFARAVGSIAPSIDFDDVTRRVRIGAAERSESGSTGGDAYGLKFTLGMDLLQTGGLKLGPQLGLSYQDVQVDGYRERGARSTSMGFGAQSRESLLFEAGLFLDYVADRWRLHAGFGREEELDDDSPAQEAYLVTLPGSRFSMYDIETGSGAWVVDLGIAAQVAQGVAVSAGWSLRSDDDAGDENAFSLGVLIDL